jgi:outer membrane protein assembly factor BamA
MDERALEACLATRERARFTIDVSTNPNPACGVPEFDAPRLRAELWAWPWASWPLFDRNVFERDLARVERWYRARGHYDARVVEVRIDPPHTGALVPPSREVRIEVTVDEGEPVRVASVDLHGVLGLDPDLRRLLRETVTLRVGDRFDEAVHARVKRELLRVLRDASYARARVEGRVRIDRRAREAHVVYDVHPSLRCTFSHLIIEIEGDEVPGVPIVAAAGITPGMPFSQAAIDDAQRAIYAIGAFSSVEVVPVLDGALTELPVRIRARTGNLVRRGVGAGMLVGQPYGTTLVDAQVLSQWDIHLLGFYEHRNALGGLRRFRTEARPRLIFGDVFPNPERPQLGLQLGTEFRQPSFLEARTNFVAAVRYDLGPDPFARDFSRHLVDGFVGPERSFLRGKLYANAHLRGAIFAPFATSLVNEQDPYGMLFLEQTVRLDLRDDPVNPRSGFFLQIGLQQSGYVTPSSWDYVRATPEVRAYLSLPLGIVVAARFGIGILEITRASSSLRRIVNSDLDRDATCTDPSDIGTCTEYERVSGPALLGPDTYRLRGGGASSNRGFLPGRLGGAVHQVDGIAVLDDPRIGGIRRWEASLEVRIPLTESLGAVLFADAGDVSPTRRLRFDAPQLSLGLGLRYRTLIGPIRLDLGLRQPWARCFGPVCGELPPVAPQSFLFDAWKIGGAVHITVGEAF